MAMQPPLVRLVLRCRCGAVWRGNVTKAFAEVAEREFRRLHVDPGCEVAQPQNAKQEGR